jgi:hypothetical protein
MKTIFYTARFPCEVIWLSEVHSTAGSDAGAVTLQIELLTGTQAPGAGSTLLDTAFNLKGTANTVVKKAGTDLTSTVTLDEGDRLALLYSGTLTAVAGVQVTAYMKPLGRGSYRVLL